MSETEALSPEKQEQILRGAAAVFAEDGYEGASMSRIAARAGVSKGTLYNYFDGKAEMFAAWITLECQRTMVHMFDTAANEGEVSAVLRRIGLQMLRVMISPAGITMNRMAVSESQKFPELARAFYNAGPARATRHMADWLQAHTGAGRLFIPDAEFAAQQFFALCQTRLGILRNCGMLADVNDAAIERVVDGAVAMFLCYYGEPR
jgi:TetR/AcrR family transcriptional regulator, mexJK operon transcriptional repressor